MRLHARELASENCEDICATAAPGKGPSPSPAEDYSWVTVIPELDMPGKLCVGSLECRARAMRLAKLERHVKTAELLSAVDGDAVLCLAPPQEPARGSLSGLRAVYLRRGSSVVLHPGVWHGIPFPAGSANVRLMVVFRALTGEDDLDFFELEEAVDIRM